MSFIVVLDDGVADDDAKAIATAIGLFRGVRSVTAAADGDAESQATRDSINEEWRRRIVGLLDDEGV
jgi:hypothetical protein